MRKTITILFASLAVATMTACSSSGDVKEEPVASAPPAPVASPATAATAAPAKPAPAIRVESTSAPEPVVETATLPKPATSRINSVSTLKELRQLGCKPKSLTYTEGFDWSQLKLACAEYSAPPIE